MIAAGSLFTSCVENTEPQGIKDLRLAKADYLDALSNLRAADAEKVKAEATLVQAQAATEQAVAAYNQAIAKAKELANEAQKVQDEVAAAKAKADIDSIKSAAAKAAVVAQQALAVAQADLDSALRKITAQSFDLTQDEKDAISDATTNLNEAYNAYNAALNGYNFTAMLLWDAEYNVEAGVEGYETAESFKDSIAAREIEIAEAKTTIAKYEAVKEHPESAQEFIDEYKEENKQAQEDSLNAWSEQNLYEVTVLVEANKAYKEKVAAFKKDSVGETPAAYCFTKDAKNKTVVKYPLTDGKGLDARFGMYLNSIKHAKSGKTANAYGIAVNGKNIEVGGASVTNEKYLDSALVVVDEIVEALNRDLVVVNDSSAADSYEQKVKQAAVADSIYKDHRAILEAGLAKYGVYEAANDTVEMFKDTVAAAKKADTLAREKVAADSVAIKAAVKTAAADYIAANKAFVEAVNDIVGTSTIKTRDSAAFIKAVQDLGKAQAAYLGYTDSLELVTVVDGAIKNYKVSVSALEASGFVEKAGTATSHSGQVTSLYGGTGYGWFAGKTAYYNEDDAWYSKSDPDYAGKLNAFSRVAKAILGTPSYNFTANITEADVAKQLHYNNQPAAWYSYDNKSAIAYKHTDPSTEVDTVLFAKAYTKSAVAEIATHDADVTAAEAAAAAVTAAEGKLAAKETAVNTAKEKYFSVYKSFWGINAIGTQDTAKVVAPQKFAWSDKTFSEPENCIVFGRIPGFAGIIGERGILENNELVIALDGIDGVGYVTEKYINSCTIFKGENDVTEFTKALYFAQIRDEAANYEFLEDQLANINEQVAAIKADVKAYNEQYAEAWKAYNDALVALTGKGKAEVAELSDANVKDGKWNLAGKQLEFAKEVAPDYPTLVKAFLDSKKAAEQTIAENNAVIAKLDKVAEAWAKLENPEFKAATVEEIIDLIDDAIDDVEDDIKDLEDEIKDLEKAVAACEAGYSPAKAKVDFLKTVLEQKEVALEQAEYALDQAKKVYNAVIENYK